ncbi:MAG: hypothetical protein IPL61_12030 [Myxococcales bacterium]|nr:hypothetical protein [Myxococcales bacterium]
MVSGPLPAVAGGRPWYLVGVAPRLTDQSLERAAFRQADADGDGVADRDGAGAIVHEAIASGERAAIAYDVPFVARAGLRFGHHQLDVTALGEVARSPRWIVPAEDSAAGVERTSLVGTASATWRGQWGATSVRLQGAWFRSDRTDDARIAAGDAPAIGSAYVPPVTELPIGDARSAGARGLRRRHRRRLPR